ncbi:hypothetical protein HMPREF1019_01695 [Campylobacter sp. 10_1_50]|nr:hypothetical protein HMPREF1019_01695 [Campylobacter sp. 10_1_50]
MTSDEQLKEKAELLDEQVTEQNKIIEEYKRKYRSLKRKRAARKRAR